MSTFVKLTSGKVIYTDNSGKKFGFSPGNNVLPHPYQDELVIISNVSSALTNKDNFVFDWRDVTSPSAASREALIQELSDNFFFEGQGAFITGKVEFYADLPLASEQTGNFWLVEKPSGIWLINRKPAGLYISNGTTWNAAPDIVPFFNDANFEIYNNVDNTKAVKFDVSPIPTSTKRIVTTSNKDTNLEDLFLNWISTPTWKTLKDFIRIFGNSGIISGGNITDNLDGTVNISSGTALIRSSNNDTAELYSFDFPGANNIVLTDVSENYIYIDYNSGSPIIAVTTIGSTIKNNENNLFELYEVYRNGTDLHITLHKQKAGNTIKLLQQYLYSRVKIARADAEGGLILGETGTRNVTMSAGKIWVKLNNIALVAINTSISDTFDRYYGTTKQTGITQWDNDNYNNAGVLTTLTVGRYSYQDFYIESDNGMVSIYGTAQYTLQVNAENAPLPPVPDRLKEHALYIGRITFQKGDIIAKSILIPFDAQLPTSGVTIHANLGGLTADDHLQYLLLAGRAGGQIAYGGINAGDDLNLRSTSNATKGNINLGLNSTYDEVNDRLGLNKLTPSYRLDVNGISYTEGFINNQKTIFSNKATSPTLTGNVNDLVITNFASRTVIELITDGGNREVTGINSTGVVNGQIFKFVILDARSGTVKFKANSASSAAGNRFIIPADLNIIAGDGIEEFMWRNDLIDNLGATISGYIRIL